MTADGPPNEGNILILDDEPLVTRTLDALLKVESPWEVTVYNRVHEAVASLEENRYQAVISDFLMPEMDGIQFLALVKEKLPFASRILLTGYADKRNAIRSINEVGLFHYIEKPWENADLLLIVRNAVERSHLLEMLDEKVKTLAENDRSVEDLRDRLLKTIL